MPKLGREIVSLVQDALERYEEEVMATDMALTTKNTYVLHARNFVRWLDDDFEPGVNLRRRERGS